MSLIIPIIIPSRRITYRKIQFSNPPVANNYYPPSSLNMNPQCMKVFYDKNDYEYPIDDIKTISTNDNPFLFTDNSLAPAI